MICPDCKIEVETNGCGSTSSKFNKIMKKSLDTIYPYTQEFFKPICNKHDIDYHRGPKINEPWDVSKKRADSKMKSRALKKIKKSGKNWLVKKWLTYQANKYYKALEVAGDDAFQKRNCVLALKHGYVY